MTDAERLAWVSELRERIARIEPARAVLLNARTAGLLLDFVEHLLLRVRNIEAREGIE